jgi:hypothetical protein
MSEFIVIWYQPLLGALHVLGVAAFGATLLTHAPILRRIGLAWMLSTGVLLYLANAERLASNKVLWLKLGLVALAVAMKGPRWLTLALWAAVIFAARWIAYF